MNQIKPVRLQLSRKKGFNLQAWSLETNGLPAVKCDRSTKLGNPFPVEKCTSIYMGVTKDTWTVGTWTGPAMWIKDSKDEAVRLSVDAYRSWITSPPNASTLSHALLQVRGKNLACWCKPGTPCHADVLLEIANAPACEAVG